MESAEGYEQISYKEFLDQFETIAKENNKLVGIFMSSTEEGAEKYWCPDCEAIRENLKDVLLPIVKERNLKAIHVDYGSRAEWKNQDHPLRKNEAFQIVEIPTIATFENGKLVKALIEAECFKAENIKELLNNF